MIHMPAVTEVKLSLHGISELWNVHHHMRSHSVTS